MPRPRLGCARVLLTLPLASCISPEELRREDEATCFGYGFHPGTDAFATCLQRESLARRYSGPPPAPYWGWGFWWGAGWGPYWRFGPALSDPNTLGCNLQRWVRSANWPMPNVLDRSPVRSRSWSDLRDPLP